MAWRDMRLTLIVAALGATDETWLYVSPRTGVAVTAAGVHAPRLLPLPSFLGGESEKTLEEDLLDGMELTGHFLEKKVFRASASTFTACASASY